MTGCQTLHRLVEEAADRRPNHTCLKFGEHAGMSYAETWAAIGQCAGAVVNFESNVVALVADRSYGLVISLLGVLRAGKAYCPIEPDFPLERAVAMIETARLEHALVPASQVPQPLVDHTTLKPFMVHDDGRVCDAYTGSPMPSNPEKVPRQVPDDATAYVLFTSGSTGKPKGCMVPHRGSTLYARAVVEHCMLSEDMTFLLKTPYVFDVSVQDMFSAFAAGGTLVIAAPQIHKDAGAIADAIISNGVDCACFVPTLLVEFVKYLSQSQDVHDVKKTLTRVLTIGEALMTGTCRHMLELLPELQIHNLYGPTEASVGVSHHMVTRSTIPDSAVVPVGRPFSYVNFCLCDPSMYEGQEQIKEELLVSAKPGETGELFIGGDCLAQGYIHNPEKTQAVFFNFPKVSARPAQSASPHSLYKTGDLCRVRPDGTFDYLGRNDFQVKISGVRIECEEVSAVLKTHPAIDDALVTAFESPFGKALAAYVVTQADVDWSVPAEEGEKVNVENWGAVYDEMYKETDNSISEQDPTLNWSGYTDTYSRRPHLEPVIKEWVNWSCEQVSAHKARFEANRAQAVRSCVTELGCGNGMLLFRLAPLLGDAGQGKYLGTDISSKALEYINEMKEKRDEYRSLGIETQILAAHEVLKVCEERENDMLLCNGVTMYFPSANYLVECMQLSAASTKPGGLVIYGDIQSKRHLLPFRAHVETYQSLRRQDATAAAVLQAAKQTAAREELSYFDDELFHRLDRAGSAAFFQGRLARVEMRVKRGWWHSEFNRFRYDVCLVLQDEHTPVPVDPELLQVSFAEVCNELQLSPPAADELVDPRLSDRLPAWVAGRLGGLGSEKDGLVVSLPNARTYQAVKLLSWLEAAAAEGRELKELPGHLHPVAAELSGLGSQKYGVEPEMLFSMALPEGWTQRVVWDADAGYVRLVLLRAEAAGRPWLGAACQAVSEPLPSDLSAFRNKAEDVGVAAYDPLKAINDTMKVWTSGTSLLPAMRPSVYIPMGSFPKNTAGKTDRAALPSASDLFSEISNAANAVYEPPVTEDEKKMVRIWEKVLKVQVSVNTPFIDYGGHSLTAIQLCSSIASTFGQRPDLVFLTSEDCTVRALLAKLAKGRDETVEADSLGCIVRLSPSDRRGVPLLIFGAAGSSIATYQAFAEQLTLMQVYAVELPGRGRRTAEPTEARFKPLFESLASDVMAWAQKHRRFFAWGDSLGTVIAYEFARLWQEDARTNLMGLFVSGNAGPTEASDERGMGESVMGYLGLTLNCCADMTRDDWKAFLRAASGPSGAQELEKIFRDKDLADSLINPLRADCLAYESYHLDAPVRIRAPIVSIRGGEDHITSPGALKSWSIVAGGLYEHKEFPGFGHMLARECPKLLANLLLEHSLPDFRHELRKYETFRAAYRLMRTPKRLDCQNGQKKEVKKSMRVCSPTVGARSVPKDIDLSEVEFNLTMFADTITPPTKEMKSMRRGNLEWRRGHFLGNQYRFP